MPRVRLSGQLVCADATEVAIVIRYLPAHLALTRNEPGCLSFEVGQTSDPLSWQVDELFLDADAFAAHQRRVALGEWGRATAGIERRYAIEHNVTAEPGSAGGVAQ